MLPHSKKKVPHTDIPIYKLQLCSPESKIIFWRCSSETGQFILKNPVINYLAKQNLFLQVNNQSSPFQIHFFFSKLKFFSLSFLKLWSFHIIFRTFQISLSWSTLQNWLTSKPIPQPLGINSIFQISNLVSPSITHSFVFT